MSHTPYTRFCENVYIFNGNRYANISSYQENRESFQEYIFLFCKNFR